MINSAAGKTPRFLRTGLRLALVSANLLICVAGHGSTSAESFDEDHKQEINGTVLHFRVRGVNRSNPYLLVLHGGPGPGAHMFYPWGISLEGKLNMVYLDQRGSGESARIKFANPDAPTAAEVKDFSIDNLVRDIEGVRASLGVNKWYVLGHSWGGMLGLEYVSRHPNQVAGYIHMDGAVSMPMVLDDLLEFSEARFRKDAEVGDSAKKARVQANLTKLREIRAMTPSPQKLFEVLDLAGKIENFDVARPEAANAYYQKVLGSAARYGLTSPAMLYAQEPQKAIAFNRSTHFFSRDDRPLLARIKVPTIIINGEEDPVVKPKMARIAHAGIKGSELLILKDCGHGPFGEQPERTTAAILDFVQRHPLKAKTK